MSDTIFDQIRCQIFFFEFIKMPIKAIKAIKAEETAKDLSKEEDSDTQHDKESDESSSDSTEEEEEEVEEEEGGVALDDLSEEEVDEDVVPQQHVTINNKVNNYIKNNQLLY